MRAKKSKPREPIGAPLSAKCVSKIGDLEGLREKVRSQIVFCERRIGEGKKVAEQQRKTAAGGSYVIQQALSATLADIEERERLVKVYKDEEKSLSVEIEALAHPTPAQAAQRRKHQAALAALAVERLRKDVAIDSVLQHLRKLLQGRATLTGKMQEVAGLLDFAATVDLDAARFAALLDALPAGVLAQSHDWLNTFFGQENDKQCYSIGRTGCTLPETLADAGIYRSGAVAFLGKQRAKFLPVEDAAAHVPSAAEVELAAGNRLMPAAAPPPGQADDDFPVSGFRVL
jgi:hypothetical protein